MNKIWLGTWLLVASAAAYSGAGFFTRLIPVDAWTLLFWRGLFGGTFLAAIVAWQLRGRFSPAPRAVLLRLGSRRMPSLTFITSCCWPPDIPS